MSKFCLLHIYNKAFHLSKLLSPVFETLKQQDKLHLQSSKTYCELIEEYIDNQDVTSPQCQLQFPKLYCNKSFDYHRSLCSYHDESHGLYLIHELIPLYYRYHDHQPKSLHPLFQKGFPYTFSPMYRLHYTQA